MQLNDIPPHSSSAPQPQPHDLQAALGQLAAKMQLVDGADLSGLSQSERDALEFAQQLLGGG